MKVEQKKFWRNVAFIVVVTIAALWLNLGEEMDAPDPVVSSKSKSGNTNGALKGSFVLALSWQAAFCEKKPNKPECRSQRKGRFDAEKFVLHGLWPQPQNNVYCDASINKNTSWSRLPKLNLSSNLRKELETKMPGYRSNLHRHEWAKHGTCANNVSAEQYFQTSLGLLDSINASSLTDYVAENIGKRITLQQAAKRMDESFGKGAGKRLAFFCNRDGGRNLVSEIRISLSANGDDDLLPAGQHILAASPLRSQCKSGIIDPIGLQ